MSIASFPLSFDQLVALTVPESIGKGHRPAQSVMSARGSATLALIESAMHAGIVDFQKPVGDLGHGVLVLWDAVFEEGLPSRVLKHAVYLDPDLGPRVDGLPALVQALDFIVSKAVRDKAAGDRIVDWLAAAPFEVLCALDGPGHPPGTGLLAWFARLNTPIAHGGIGPGKWADVVAVAMSKGLKWMDVPASVLASSPYLPPNLLTALCDRGLDLMAPQGQPRWEAIIGLGRPNLTCLVHSWMNDAPSGTKRQSAFEEVEKVQYLEKFLRRQSGVHVQNRREKRTVAEERADLIAHLVSRPDWVDVVDSDGRSAFFHAVLANPGVLRHALENLRSSDPHTRSSWEKALTHRDRAGRNVWFYLLPNSRDNTLTENLLFSLSKVVPFQADAKGEEWFIQLLSDVKSSLRVLSLPGTSKPLKRLPVPLFKGDVVTAGVSVESRDIRLAQWVWEAAGEGAREKALAGACKDILAASTVLAILPDTAQTMAVKALALLMRHPKESARPGTTPCSEIESLLEKIQSEPETTLPVSKSLMERVRTAQARLLAPEGPALKERGDRHLQILARVAVKTRLSQDLPQVEATPRVRF